MANLKTTIEWCDRTWSPVTGCTKVSPGCKNCYAEGVAEQFWRGRKFTDVVCHPERLDMPLRWRQPSRVFVNSMSDLFHEDVPTEFINRVWSTMCEAPRHSYQILTKRPGRMREYMLGLRGYVFSNIWLGVSVENQETADERVPLLLDTPSVVRFLSVEPLLEPLDLVDIVGRAMLDLDMLASSDPGIHWVIVGGESGPSARPCNIKWVRSIVAQCKFAKVPVFVKQLGRQCTMNRHDAVQPCGLGAGWKSANGESEGVVSFRDRKGGDPLEWPIDLRIREYPAPRQR